MRTGGPLAPALLSALLAAWSLLPASAQLPPRTPAPAQPARGAEPQDALSLLRSGRYDDAIAAFERDTALRAQDFLAWRGRVLALSEVGRYAEAEQAARAFLAGNERSAEMWTTLGDLLVLRGRAAEAEPLFAKAIAGRARDALSAEAGLAELHRARGREQAASQAAERLVDAYNGGRARTASDLIAVGRACRLLGRDNPQAFKDALAAFDQAAEADPADPEPRLLAGELFLEKYNGTEARAAFQQVLQANPRHPRALLGMARAKDFDGERGVPELIEKSLAQNKAFAEARAYRATLLTALEDYPAAGGEAEAALGSNPESLAALAALAAARYLQGDTAGFAAARAKAEALYPANGELLATVAEACVRNRLYRQAAELVQQALALEPRSWQALATLGQNQLRLGRIEEGRKSLERSFEGDPYNVWVKNTLDLLDTFPRYATTRSGRFELFLEAKESPLLAPYVAALAEEAVSKLGARYQFTPEAPIRVEVYPSHADFSVRTVGLAGLGALGVCFGNVVAIDSPSARERGQLNWGSTLWHELAHTITLGLTEHRVPRWLTEGVSVYEERRARQGWGDDLSVEFLVALKAGKLLPLRELNNGFVRPESPGQVQLSYYQASLVVEEIEAQHGLAGLLGLLRAYRDGRDTAAAFESALGTGVDAFDRGFRERLQQRLAGQLAVIRVPGAAPATRAVLEQRARDDERDFLAKAALGRMLLAEKRHEEALALLEEARELLPESAGEESPYWPLAQIKRERGDLRGAAEALRQLAVRNENHEQANLELARILEQLGDEPGALQALERAVYIYPLDKRLFERIAALQAKRGDAQGLVKARRALVALDPPDPAEALYQLALAELQAGDRAAARRAVLRALEAAPRFTRAQELLLRIHREGKS